MTEPQNTEPTGTPDPKPEPKPEPIPAAASGTDPEKLRAALAKQAEEFRANEAKLQKQLQAYESEKLKSKEAKMIEEGQLKELIAERDKKIQEMSEQTAAASRALLEAAAREKLRDLGMIRPLALAGAVAGLPADATAESLETWVAKVHLDNAPEFTAPATPVLQPSAGDPSTSAAGADLESRLKSDDKTVKKSAHEELLRNRLNGITTR